MSPPLKAADPRNHLAKSTQRLEERGHLTLSEIGAEAEQNHVMNHRGHGNGFNMMISALPALRSVQALAWLFGSPTQAIRCSEPW